MKSIQEKKLRALKFCTEIRDFEKKGVLSELTCALNGLEESNKRKKIIDELLAEAETEIMERAFANSVCDPALMELKYAYLDQLYAKRLVVLKEIKLYEKNSKDLKRQYKLADANHEIVKNRYDSLRKAYLDNTFSGGLEIV